MTDAEQAEEFRKALLRQAYQDFLAWAWNKGEILDQFREYAEAQFSAGDDVMHFEDWVTETYWGEIE